MVEEVDAWGQGIDGGFRRELWEDEVLEDDGAGDKGCSIGCRRGEGEGVGAGEVWLAALGMVLSEY